MNTLILKTGDSLVITPDNTNEITGTAHYADRSSDGRLTPDSSVLKVSAASEASLVAAASDSSAKRIVKEVSLYNAGGTTTNVAIGIKRGGTVYRVANVALTTGATWSLTKNA